MNAPTREQPAGYRDVQRLKAELAVARAALGYIADMKLEMCTRATIGGRGDEGPGRFRCACPSCIAREALR